MTTKGLGATSVVDDSGVMMGVLTDGDMRRILQQGHIDLDKALIDVLSEIRKRIAEPKSISPDSLGVKALDVMEQFSITTLPFVDESGCPIGMIHLHDLIRAGITS